MISPAVSVNTATAAQYIGNTMRSDEQPVGLVHTLLLTPIYNVLNAFPSI